MVALLTTPDRMGGRFHSHVEARSEVVQLSIEAASEAIWRELGAPEGEDFAYASGVTERYRSNAYPSIRLRRRPVSSVTSVTVRDVRGTLIRTIDPTEYTITEANKGLLHSSEFPDSRTIGFAPYEMIATGMANPFLEVTYTGGWVTPAQADADPSLTTNLPAELELACQTQVVSWVEDWSSNLRVQTHANPSLSTTYRPQTGMLLPEVKEVCRRHRRYLNFGGW